MTPRGLNRFQAFGWYIPGQPPFVEGAPPEQQPCWDWPGTLNNGYGFFGAEGRQYFKAHRVSYELFVGQIPIGLWVLHSCDRRICVQPAHLHLGTVQLNNLERDERGGTVFGDGHGRTHLLDGDIRFIRETAGIITQTDIATVFGIAQTTVSAIRRRETWQHIN